MLHLRRLIKVQKNKYTIQLLVTVRIKVSTSPTIKESSVLQGYRLFREQCSNFSSDNRTTTPDRNGKGGCNPSTNG